MSYKRLTKELQKSFRGIVTVPSTILNKLNTYSKKNKLYQAFRELGSAIRTLFLLKYLSNEKLRSTIQAATNNSESFNGFAKWVFFGSEGIIAENNREGQRKIIKYNHLIANCLIFYNVFQLTRILHEYIQEENKIDAEVLSDLSPYLIFHVNRFKKYRLDSNQRPPDIEFDIPVSPIPIEVAGNLSKRGGYMNCPPLLLYVCEWHQKEGIIVVHL